MLLHIFTAAKLIWARKWKNQKNQKKKELLKLLDIVEMERLSETLCENPRTYVTES